MGLVTITVTVRYLCSTSHMESGPQFLLSKYVVDAYFRLGHFFKVKK